MAAVTGVRQEPPITYRLYKYRHPWLISIKRVSSKDVDAIMLNLINTENQ
jgi:hypothetical protein